MKVHRYGPTIIRPYHPALKAIFEILYLNKTNDHLTKTARLKRIKQLVELIDKINLDKKKQHSATLEIFMSLDGSEKHKIKSEKLITLNAVNQRGNTALMVAIINKRDDIASYLISLNKFNINLKNSKGHCPLYLSIKYNNFKTAKHILESKEFKPDEYSSNLLRNAATFNRIDIFKQIAASKVIDIDKRPPRCVAPIVNLIPDQYARFTEVLIKAGANINIIHRNKTLLEISVSDKHYHTAYLLLLNNVEIRNATFVYDNLKKGDQRNPHILLCLKLLKERQIKLRQSTDNTPEETLLSIDHFNELHTYIIDLEELSKHFYNKTVETISAATKQKFPNVLVGKISSYLRPLRYFDFNDKHKTPKDIKNALALVSLFVEKEEKRPFKKRRL